MSLSTSTSDGGRVESWLDASSGFNTIHAQKYDAAGQKVGGELVLSQRVIGPYDVAGLAGGGYALVYASASPGGSWGQISIQGADGSTVAQSSTAAGTDFHLTAADGGFLVNFHGIAPDSGLDVSTPLLEFYDAAGHSLNHGHVQLAGQIASITPQAGGDIAVNWSDGGTIRTLTFDPHSAASLSTPANPGVTVIDDVGAQTGAVPNGATTDDATPTVRISVAQAGEAFVELDKGVAHYDNQGGGIAITPEDVARGYIDIALPTSGDGDYTGWVRVTDASGSASYPVGFSFHLQAAAATSGGQVLSASQADDTLTGGGGDDTLNASQGADHLTGGGGHDAFVFAHEPWAPAEITDFAVGIDRLDLSGLFRDAGYTGSDPVADGYVWLLDDGHGGTEVLFDKDGHGTAQQWPDYVIHLDGVAACGLTWAKLAAATSAASAPADPPSLAAGQTLQAADGGSTLTGGAGADTLIGAHGPDVMTGAGGADHFVFKVLPWSAAEITDFTHGSDKIDVSALLSAAGYTGGDPIGDGYVKLIDNGAGGSWLYIDMDGRGSADPWGAFVATLDHVTPGSVSASDWIFH